MMNESKKSIAAFQFLQESACMIPGAYEPPKAARSVQLRRTAFALRAFSAFRIRTVLDNGEYPLSGGSRI